MFRKFVIASLIASIVNQTVNCAMKKSWKSAANFDTEIPKFTPFEVEGTLISKAETDLNEVKMETTRTTEKTTSPSPTSETLVNRLSSKIRAPSKHVASVYNLITKEAIKNQNFDVIEANMAHDSQDVSQEEIPPKFYSEAQHEADRNQIDLSQILSDLTGEAESESVTDDDVDTEDEIEVHENQLTNSTEYKVGSLMNVTVIDGASNDSLVNVNVDRHTIKRIFTGRGRKNGILERVVPLFILPFLIQSAFVPFIVTMIKLFLMKSLFAGKIAILLLLLGALKNHQHGMYMKSMQHSPYSIYKDYPSPFPERRHEQHFDGYKVEGKPESIIQ